MLAVQPRARRDGLRGVSGEKGTIAREVIKVVVMLVGAAALCLMQPQAVDARRLVTLRRKRGTP